MGQKILLADDSITIQKVIELTFSDEDFELHTVGNGQKAIDEIRSIKPDIVLCDIIMPEKNGYEVCEFIKSNEDLKHVPVLLLTGAFEPFDQERAKAAGCEGFLAKPFEPQTLISKVKELLAGARSAPAAAPPALTTPEPIAAPPTPPPMPAPLADAGTTQSPAPIETDETVLVPPPMTEAPPPVEPPTPAAPTPPPPPAAEVTPGLDEGFAVEAGERELAMDPGDHTMLLGTNEAPEAPPPTPPGANDDIWSEVGTPDAVPPQEDDAATVFMAGPPPTVQPEDMDLAGSIDNEMNVTSEDPDATWQMPSTAEPDAAAPPAPPAGDFGGFEDFAAPPAPPTPSVESDVPPPPPAMELPSEPSAPPADPFTPDAPEIGPSDSALPPMPPEPIPSVDTEATIDPVSAGIDYPPLSTPPVAPEPPSPPEPQRAHEELPAETPPEVVPEVVDDAVASPEPETPFAALEAPMPPEPPVQPVQDFQEVPEPPSEPPPAPSPTAAEAEPTSGGADDDLVERVAQRVVDKLSSKIIQEIAWEVVPDLAEGLIQKEIDALKSKMPKSG